MAKKDFHILKTIGDKSKEVTCSIWSDAMEYDETGLSFSDSDIDYVIDLLQKLKTMEPKIEIEYEYDILPEIDNIGVEYKTCDLMELIANDNFEELSNLPRKIAERMRTEIEEEIL